MPELSLKLAEPEPKAFWQVMSNRAVSVSIITAIAGDHPAGFLGLSASHLTAFPPLLTVSIDLRTSALEVIRSSKAFAVNYLSEQGQDTYTRFSSGSRGAARFEGIGWKKLLTGAPIFNTVVAAFDCRVEDFIERDGVVLAVGRVVSTLEDRHARPLVYFRGQVGHLPGTFDADAGPSYLSY